MQQVEFHKIFAGKAIFTLIGKKTGKRFTYKLIKKSESIHLLFVMTDYDCWMFAGYCKDKILMWSLKSKLQPTDIRWLAIKYLFQHPNTEHISLIHSGRCMKCGKTLTTPESILSGIGPKCRTF